MSNLLKSKNEPKLKKQASSSDEQQAKINEVRELLGDLPTEMPGFLTDSTIRRFLRTRNWSTVQATKALKETVKWRRQYRPDKIRWSLVPAKEQVKLLVYNLETMSSKNAQENIVWVVDFSGWTVSSTPLAESRQSVHIIQNYYPGLVGAAILCNPPKIFESFWKILNYFIEPELKEKVKFVYTNNSESQRIMADMFDLDKLESAFGGRNTSGIDIVKYSERMQRRDQTRNLHIR
ncbi:uncharacterized protein [Miscanthus floridulus]|uniref:uncharacterized protein isoform X2 n=1 Tax=Miscanthus floridulus TaxID=154761 RepID=UPI00345A54B4